MKLVGANPNPQVVGLEELPGKVHYFLGNDPTKWRTNIPTYAKVKIQNLYPGVNLVYYGNQRQLEYDFVVSPGADLNSIKLAFEGTDNLEVDAQGNLVLDVTPVGHSICISLTFTRRSTVSNTKSPAAMCCLPQPPTPDP